MYEYLDAEIWMFYIEFIFSYSISCQVHSSARLHKKCMNKYNGRKKLSEPYHVHTTLYIESSGVANYCKICQIPSA